MINSLALEEYNHSITTGKTDIIFFRKGFQRQFFSAAFATRTTHYRAQLALTTQKKTYSKCVTNQQAIRPTLSSQQPSLPDEAQLRTVCGATQK